MSLRDQLLQAGLVSEKQAKEAERQLQQKQQGQQHLPKRQRGLASEQQLAAQHTQAAKVARDQELSRRQQEKADRKARWAQIKQLVEQSRLPRVETDEYYSFVDGSKVRRIAVDAAMRERLSCGEVAIVRHDGRYELVPEVTASRIRERDERAVIAYATPNQASPADDPYKDYAVPDDLTW